MIIKVDPIKIPKLKKYPFESKEDEQNISNVKASEEQIIYRLQKQKVSLFKCPTGKIVNTYVWGKIGVVVNKNHKWYNKIVVVCLGTDKQYDIRLATEFKSEYEMIGCNIKPTGVINSAYGKFITCSIKKESVKKFSNILADTGYVSYMKDTLALLKKYKKMKKENICPSIKNK
jgi:hypothetical protein